MEPNYNSPPHPNQYLYQSPHQPTMFLSHPNLALNLNHSHDSNNTSSDVDGREKVPMFEKPLTPSDVGKLNRLVIPKQHAEKYFPLGGCGDAAGDKGLLLSFEDESGKCWRFRYSYWNSSQSYVLTKGWSRYVKEKQLDAGDVILFLRHRTDTHRLFIGWRRRGAETAVTTVLGTLDRGSGNEIAGWSRAYQNPYLGQVQEQGQPTECLHAGSVEDNEAAEANPRRLLRLFGVNLECHGEPQSSTTLHHPHDSFYSSNFMDMALSGDMNHMRNHRG